MTTHLVFANFAQLFIQICQGEHKILNFGEPRVFDECLKVEHKFYKFCDFCNEYKFGGFTKQIFYIYYTIQLIFAFLSELAFFAELT